MDKVCVKRWIEDGSAVIVDCGFLPTFAILIENSGGTNPDIFLYTKQWHDTETLYALKLTGSTGVVTRMTTAATGMDEYDVKSQGVLVANPAGGDDQFRVPTTWAAATDYSSGYTARSATAAGDLVYPPTKNGRVFELTTATGAGTSEPSSWDVAPGETVTDGGSNVFTCREEKVKTKGVQGLTVGATTQTDGQYSTLVAFDSLVNVNVGDVANLGATDFA